MFWIFALGLIVLAVYHRGFRKVLLWVMGSAVAAIALTIGFMASKESYDNFQQTQKQVNAGREAHTAQAVAADDVDIRDLPVPPADMVQKTGDPDADAVLKQLAEKDLKRAKAR